MKNKTEEFTNRVAHLLSQAVELGIAGAIGSNSMSIYFFLLSRAIPSGHGGWSCLVGQKEIALLLKLSPRIVHSLIKELRNVGLLWHERKSCEYQLGEVGCLYLEWTLEAQLIRLEQHGADQLYRDRDYPHDPRVRDKLKLRVELAKLTLQSSRVDYDNQ